jgi:signal transduction histidine kinase/CheY-like chemotaxis protein
MTGKSVGRSLFRRYVVYLVGLVLAVVVANSAVSLYFSYVDQRALLEASQRDKLAIATQRIEQFIGQIDTLSRATLRFGHIAQGQGIVEVRGELFRLLRQAPAISEALWVDTDGRLAAEVSRFDVDDSRPSRDFGSDPAVIDARRDHRYVGPVVFRNDTEPYMRIAWSGGAESRGNEVLIDRVNLKLLGDELAALTVVASREAYVVDSAGQLISHPDIGLVLRKTSMAHRPQVRAALEAPLGEPPGVAIWRESVSGDPRWVSTAHQAIPSLGWHVFVEQPLQQAFAPLIAAAERALLLLAAGIAVSIVAALAFARQLSRPIRALSQGVARLGEGKLDARVQLESNDELRELADQFNRMADRLGESQEELEARIEERTRDLARANAAQARFLAAASHDLRQPAHALGLYVAQLKDATTTLERERLLGRIEASSTAVSQLLDVLFDLSKLDAGKVEATPRVVAVQVLLNRLEQHFSLAARGKGLVLRVRRSPEFIRTDPLLLERVLMNLVSNAVQHTPRGGVLVGCRRRGDGLRIEVWDCGVGIAADEQARVFDEFYQASGRSDGATRGLGLGLAIVQRIGHLLDAPIILRSVEGRGSMFAIEVPRVDESAARASAPSAAVAAPSTRFDGATALLVDDDDAARDAASGLLERWGWTVVSAASHAQALALVAGLPRAPDAIVTDYQLGRGSLGTGLIEAVRAHCGVSIPSVIVTGEPPEFVGRAAQAIGAHVLGKPLQPAQLRAVLQYLRDQGAAKINEAQASARVDRADA